MEKESNKTLCSTEGTTVHQDDPARSDSTDIVNLNVPRKGSHMVIVTDPRPKLTIANGGMAAGRRGLGFKSLTKHPMSPWVWKSHKSLVYGISNPGIKHSKKIAMFDMDDTLIVNKTGLRMTDWEFFHPCVPDKLKELFLKGYRIVIASNQLGISLNLVSEKDIQTKVEKFIAATGVDATVMLSTKNDRFRKPDTGMWGFFLNTLNTVTVDLDHCVD